MGSRRAGYIASLIFTILGIVVFVPIGLLGMTVGAIEGIFHSGSADGFMLGLSLTILGSFMFVVGLITSIILKKDRAHVNISINAKDSVIQGNFESRPTLGHDMSKYIEAELPIPEKTEPQIEHTTKPQLNSIEEDVSLQDMVIDLQGASMGDHERLKYISKRLERGQHIYKSDEDYVKRHFAILRSKITGGEDE